MLKEAIEATRPVFNRLGAGRNRVFARIGGYIPDIYTAADAGYYLSQIKNRPYALGSTEINPQEISDQAKILSIPPPVMEKLKGVIEEAGHTQPWPFVMGTYEMSDQKMRMNDLSMSDPLFAYSLVNGGIEGLAIPILRGFYYAGRRSWWRHESIHARHHLQMSHFMGVHREARSQFNEWQADYSLSEAGATIHESGIEELLTRWQSLKEARGFLEKGASALSMLMYLEYVPFTGIRNIMIDGKETRLDTVDDWKLRLPAKLAVILGLTKGVGTLNEQTHFAEALGNTAAQLLPLAAEQVEAAFWRIQAYVAIAAVSALFSSKDKGAFGHKRINGEHIPTSEYKFPYTYNPATSVARSLGFMHYLQKVWDQIPNYRQIKSVRGVDHLVKEIDERAVANINNTQHQFTMQVVEEALDPFRHLKRSKFPQDVYVKGMFVPALYLKLRDLYYH